jgi:hypothetical protein
MAPGGHAGAVLAGHRAEPALPGGRGVDVGVGAALPGADADPGRVVPAELVAQGQGGGGEQGIPGVVHVPGLAGRVTGQGQVRAYSGAGEEGGEEADSFGEIGGGEDTVQPAGDPGQVGSAGRTERGGIRVGGVFFARRGAGHRGPLVDQPDQQVRGHRLDQHRFSVTL